MPLAAELPRRVMDRRPGLPGVTMLRLTFEHGLSRAIPPHYSVALRLEGESEWSVGGERWATSPGTVGVKVPGEVYVERARDGRSRFQVIAFDDALIEEARAALEQPPSHPRASSFDGLRDARVRPLMALHERFLDTELRDAELQETLSEALTTLVTLTGTHPTRPARPRDHQRAVTRARALLDARITESVSLDELAAHARLDKFRLCRAFREQIGLPPHAYVTHRRVSLAQVLLVKGVSQAEVAARVGLYDQSQLHRHFKRIAGLTPGTFARAMR
jgi:AraC-like DNA-binding protein